MHTTLLTLGWAASALTLASGLPQAAKIYKSKNVEGLSVSSYVLWVALATWWALWGHYVGAMPTLVVNTVCTAIFAFILYHLRPSKLALAALAALVATGLIATLYVPALAVMGSLGLIVVAVPTLRSIMHSSDSSGVSALTWVQISMANLLWVVYDAAIGYPLAGLSSVVVAIGAALVVFHLLKARSMARVQETTPVTV